MIGACVANGAKNGAHRRFRHYVFRFRSERLHGGHPPGDRSRKVQQIAIPGSHVLPNPSSPAIVWFRNDLRLEDNPALNAAIERGGPVVCLYVLEEGVESLRSLGGASKWWLHHALERLSEDITALGGTLTLRRGDPRAILIELQKETAAEAVFWNRRYSEPEKSIDAEVKSALKSRDIEATSFNGSLLAEPWAFKTGSGSHYKVFTPFWKALQANYAAPPSLGRPKTITGVSLPGDRLKDWALTPKTPDWASAFPETWTPGEAGARGRLDAFLDGPVNTYKADRNRPDLSKGTSGLSPHLQWGDIGPAQIWRATRARIDAGTIDESNAMVFLSEVVWREFSYVLLYHNPDLAEENYNPSFEFMPWAENEGEYEQWCKGQTGYPIVDAGMRQLWQTGWMHNRVRMIVASFLTKHLLLPWQMGEDWFWDTLVDADAAANAASWQWTAGSGADAAPYFRVFNPITQGQKFDETGNYVRKYCPELAKLPTKYIHAPWEAPNNVLKDASVRLGETYPEPMVDHKSARQRALDAYETLKKKRDAA